MNTEITEMVRPKREVVERKFSLTVLNGGLKGSSGLDIGGGDGVDMAVSIRGNINVSLDTISIKNLDDGVLENILFRLPLGTSSSQAKRVCKLWKSIMSNRRHNEVGYLFTCRDYKDDINDSKIQLCFGEEYDHIDCNRMNYYYSHETLMVMEHCRFVYKPFPRDILVGSCNGLVCFQKEDPGDQYVQEPFAICNPLTGEFIFLKANLRADLNITWECRAVVVSNGFGYCHLTGEYKVVRLYSISEERYASYAQVYTIGSNKWRDMEALIDGTLFYDSGPGIFANGVLHWLGNEQEAGRNRIVVFDLEDEKFRELPLPPLEASEVDYSNPENELKLLGGNLCWLRRTWYRIDIWAYKKNILNTKSTGYGIEEHDQKCNYYSKNSWNWVKDFSIEYCSGSYECSASYDQPFAITKSNQVLVLGASHLYCYDPETRTISSCRKGMGMKQVIPHANSCVSLKDFGETWYGPGTQGAQQFPDK
ncbi:hypothetical protein MKW92_015670 [Papaver armeniacum]|nr:hypothetical protein MKW92_015670 [Papaver armeniacum]